MAFDIIPSIDLRNGQVVRLQQGDFDRQTTYTVDPQETARSFAAAGARWLHIVDLDGAKAGRPVQTEQIGAIATASGLRVEVGGGVRSAEDVERLLDLGVERVVIGTRAIEDWDWFTTLAHTARFADHLVLALDAKEGLIAVRGWTSTSARRAVDVAKAVSGWPLAAILYTDVARDGMLSGPNVEQTRRLAEAGDVPVLASGGVGSLEHIEILTGGSIRGVIAGRSIYEGKINLAEAIQKFDVVSPVPFC